MSLEDLTGSDKFIDDLDETNPVHEDDTLSEADDHVRGIKNVLKNLFPNLTAAMTATASEINTFAQPGQIVAYGGDTEPSGWLFLNGQTLDRTTDADLYDIFGTQFGAPSSSQFNLPDWSGRVPRGGGSVGERGGEEEVEASVPEHTHEVNLTLGSAGDHNHDFVVGLWRRTFNSTENLSESEDLRLFEEEPLDFMTLRTTRAGEHTHQVTGSTATVGGDPHNNVQPTLGLNFMVKR